jgi:hypothetical protein
MPSSRYADLVKRASDLRKSLLPAKFSATGNYTARELDCTRGYRLLVHAEVEAFLEDRVRHVANEVLKTWAIDKKLRAAMLSLATFYLEQEIVSHKQLKDEYAGTKKRIEESLDKACQAFNKAISQNNGVRERDILRLLFPIGLKTSEIDSVWLSTIDSFGASRGQVAHSSVQAQQLPDPKNELETVKVILKGLRRIDGVLTRLAR